MFKSIFRGNYRSIYRPIWNPTATTFATGSTQAFDFTKSIYPISGNALSFTRGTNAMQYRGGDGWLVYAPNNQWLQSVDLTNGVWSLNSATVTAAGSTPNSPTGFKLTENSGSQAHFFNQNYAYVAGQTYTVAFDLKAAENRYGQLAFTALAFANGYVNFDLQTGVITASAAYTGTITPLPNGYYRCSITATATASATGGTSVGLIQTGTDGRVPVYAGIPGNGIFLGAPQLELGPYVQTYNPTTSAIYYGPRLDYNPTTLAARGLQIEGARTNLLLYSSDFTNPVWTKTDVTLTANSITGPDGQQSMTLVTEGVAGTSNIVQTSAAFSVGIPTAYSLYLKRGNTDWIRLRSFGISGSDGANVWFNLATGTVGTVTNGGVATGGAGYIESLPNGIYRCTVVVNLNGADTTTTIQSMSASADGNTARVNNATYYRYGAQVEQGLFASSYIPTYAATATRASEFATVSTAGWFNQAQGTIYAVLTSTQTNNNSSIGGISIDAGSSATALEIFPNRGISTNTELYNGNTGSTHQLGSYIPNTKYKVASAYATSNFASSRNGAAVVTNNLGALPTGQTTLRLGTNDASSLFLWGWIEQFAYYNTRLPNAQLQVLST